MCYHFAILLLFGPFIKLRFSGSTISPYEVCTQAASAITSLIGSYSRLFSLHRTPSFFIRIAVASGIVRLAHAQSLNLNVPAELVRGISELEEIASSHKCGRRAVIMLQSSSSRDADIGDQAILEPVEENIRNSRTAKYFFSSDSSRVLASGYSLTNNSIFAPFPRQTLPQLVYREQLALSGFELIG